MCSGEARFYVAVRAENIERAVRIVKERYPGGKVEVLFPIEPDVFFTKDAASAWGLIWIRTPQEIAG